jgi:hypothetical protein
MKHDPLQPDTYEDMGGAGAEPHQMNEGFKMAGAPIDKRGAAPPATPPKQTPQKPGNIPNFI